MILAENANARIAGLPSSLSLLAIIAPIALFATGRIPARQPSAQPSGLFPLIPGPVRQQPGVAAGTCQPGPTAL